MNAYVKHNMRLFLNVLKAMLVATAGVVVYTFVSARHPHQRSSHVPHYMLVSVESVRSGYISKSVFSHDGRLFSAVVDEKSIKQWNTRDWSEKHAFRLPGSPSSIAFSPDGALVAWESPTGRSSTLFAQSLKSGRKLSVVTKVHSKNKSYLLFNDNNDLIVNTEDGTRTRWDTSAAFSIVKTFHSFAPLKQSVLKQSVGPCVSGEQSEPIFSLDYNNDTVRVVDGCTGRTTNSFRCSSEIYSADVARDGSKAVAGGRESGAEVWDIQTGKPLYAVSQPRFLIDDSNQYEILAVAFSHSGNILATGDQHGNVYLWNSNTGERRAFFQAIAATSLTFSADDKTLVIGNGLRGFQVCSLHQK